MLTTKIISVALAFPLMAAIICQGEPGQGCAKKPVSAGKGSKVAENSSVPTGTWGGNHIRVQVTDDGARIEYDCAHGTIDQPMKLDGNARFDVTGVHVRERGGPVRRGERPDSHPARYTGHVQDRTMTLTVTLTDTGQKIGTFTLAYEAEPRIFKCL